MSIFDQDNFLTKQTMAETKTPDNKEAFDAFKNKFNLDPANNLAIMNCLFELSEKIKRLEVIYGPD